MTLEEYRNKMSQLDTDFSIANMNSKTDISEFVNQVLSTHAVGIKRILGLFPLELRVEALKSITEDVIEDTNKIHGQLGSIEKSTFGSTH